jgi:hypothetical protein
MRSARVAYDITLLALTVGEYAGLFFYETKGKERVRIKVVVE